MLGHTPRQTPPLANTTPPPPGQTAPDGQCSEQYASYWNTFLLLPTMKLGQGYVFARVCDSVHRGGFQSSSQGDFCLGGLCLGGLCPGVSVPGGLCLGVSVQGGLCPGAVSVWGVSVWGVSVWGVLCHGDTPVW